MVRIKERKGESQEKESQTLVLNLREVYRAETVGGPGFPFIHKVNP